MPTLLQLLLVGMPLQLLGSLGRHVTIHTWNTRQCFWTSRFGWKWQYVRNWMNWKYKANSHWESNCGPLTWFVWPLSYHHHSYALQRWYCEYFRSFVGEVQHIVNFGTSLIPRPSACVPYQEPGYQTNGNQDMVQCVCVCACWKSNVKVNGSVCWRKLWRLFGKGSIN